MKTLVIIFLLFVGLNHDRKSNISACDPFLETTKLIDTINVEARLLELRVLPFYNPSLSYLEKKNLLIKAQFKSYITFRIIGCNKEFNSVISAKNDVSKKILSSDYPTKATLKCVIFKDKGIPDISKEGYFLTVVDVKN